MDSKENSKHITPGMQSDGSYVFESGIVWAFRYQVMYRIYKIECRLTKEKPVTIDEWVDNWFTLHSGDGADQTTN